uniref:Uncharacterized protein n=1 Tax=Anguilla anguilla TaxID=7936 RepID=A0A0E9S959_ANGAN
MIVLPEITLSVREKRKKELLIKIMT